METLSTLVIEIERDLDKNLRLHVARAMEELVGKIKEAYTTLEGKTSEGVRLKFTTNSGASGALGGLSWEVKEAEGYLVGIIGLSTAANYLRNLEYGERGTEGGPAGGALFTRSKAPKVKNIFEWLQLSGIEVPDYFKERAERCKKMAENKTGRKHPAFDAGRAKPWYSTDEKMQFAFAIAMKRKKFGRGAMRVIELTVRKYSSKITSYLEGATA